MGLYIGFSRSSNEGYVPVKGNPDPTNFKVIAVYETNGNTVSLVHYPGAVSYEGLKILLFRGTDSRTIEELSRIDPHFSRTGISPFARFEPTQEGLGSAIHLASRLQPSHKKTELEVECPTCGGDSYVQPCRICGTE